VGLLLVFVHGSVDSPGCTVTDAVAVTRSLSARAMGISASRCASAGVWRAAELPLAVDLVVNRAEDGCESLLDIGLRQ
jgi:hypothetical protein